MTTGEKVLYRAFSLFHPLRMDLTTAAVPYSVS